MTKETRQEMLRERKGSEYKEREREEVSEAQLAILSYLISCLIS